MYLVYTRMPGESYRRRLGSLLLYLCYVFLALINSLVCWICTSALGLVLFRIWNSRLASLLYYLFQQRMGTVFSHCMVCTVSVKNTGSKHTNSEKVKKNALYYDKTHIICHNKHTLFVIINSFLFKLFWVWILLYWDASSHSCFRL